jgi:ammonium transporter Rh
MEQRVSFRERCSDGFFWSALGMQGLFFALFVWATKYGDAAAADTFQNPNSLPVRYPMFQDVHVMMLVGFGFLMTFLRKYAYGSLSFTLLITAMAIQWAILCRGFWYRLLSMDEDQSDRLNFPTIDIDIFSLINADFCVAAVLISFGAVIGRLSPVQLVWMMFIEVIFYTLNETVGVAHIEAVDVGGSIYIHVFGAYFGLAVSLCAPHLPADRDAEKDLRSGYHSDAFSMIGTLFLWCYWPSFNAAVALQESNAQHRAVINTLLSLCASTVTVFFISRLLRGRKFDMVDIQNATLAGGVAMGASADLAIRPFGALVLGFLGGAVSVIGFNVLHPVLRQIGLSDVCGVHNLHGLPGLIGGVASALLAAAIKDSDYQGNELLLYPARDDRTRAGQAGAQLVALGVTLLIALGSGAVTGLLFRIPMWRRAKALFSDEEDFAVPSEEVPYYFSPTGVVIEKDLRQRLSQHVSEHSIHDLVPDASAANLLPKA